MIHPIFKTVQIAPSGVARRGRVECFVDLTALPERGAFEGPNLLCLYGTDSTWIEEHSMGFSHIVLVCEKSPTIEANIKKAQGEGKLVVHVEPGSVTENLFYAVGIGSPAPFWTKSGNGDATIFDPPKKVSKPSKRKRARKVDGEFKPDDPATPDVNEAYDAADSAESSES